MKNLTLLLKRAAILTAALVSWSVFNGSAQNITISGELFLQDSTVVCASYSTVYIPSLNRGTITDEDGNYTITLSQSSLPFDVEFTCIGYEAVKRRFTIDDVSAEGTISVPDIILEPLLMMLPSAYVTPGFDDPAEYIMTMVDKRAKLNKKLHPLYSAHVDYTFETHDMPIAAKVAPNWVLVAIRTAATFMGIAPAVNFCIDNVDVKAKVSLERTVKNGKEIDSFAEVTYSNVPLPEKVKKSIIKGFDMVGLYGLLYSNDAPWHVSNRKKFPLALTGTYEWEGHLVDVLTWNSAHDHFHATVHVVEDQWAILKVEGGWADRTIRIEARDRNLGRKKTDHSIDSKHEIGCDDSFYLPVSWVMSPNFFPEIRPEDHEKWAKIANEGDFKKSTKKRALQALEDNKDRVIHPYILGTFSIKY